MQSIATKRLLKDLKNLEKNPIKENGIYHIVDEDNLYNIKALIIGPSDTPYEKGFFFFELIFDNEYPFKPPVVKFCTQNGNIRYNPNLYTNGKVCLSMLNTWEGPKWTSTQSLSSILLTLQSILNEFPLQNEPGFENDKGLKSIYYNEVIQHETLNFTVFKLLKEPPRNFNEFLPIIEDYFINNFEWYIEKLKNLNETYKKKQYFVSPVYAISCQNKYDILLLECVERYSFLKEKNKINNNTKNVKIEKKSLIYYK